MKKVNNRPTQKCSRNFIGELNQFSSKFGLNYPDYTFRDTFSNGKFHFTCDFLNLKSGGTAPTKKSAKQMAAKNMIELVETEGPFQRKLGSKRSDGEIDDKDYCVIKLFNTLSPAEPAGHTKMLPVEDEASYVLESQADIEISNCISSLEEQLKMNGIEYDLTDMCKNPPVVALVIKGTHFTFMGTGSKKNEATRAALQKTLLVKKLGCS